MTPQPIKKINFEDLKHISEKNTDLIKGMILNHKVFEQGDATLQEITHDMLEKIVGELNFSLTSISILAQNQPTRFIRLFVDGVLRASEKVKRNEAQKGNLPGYDVEQDIQTTRTSIENQLANQYKTEMILWKLMEEKRFNDALTILDALDLEREGKDFLLKVEAYNWRVEVVSILGMEKDFFETLEKIFAYENHAEVTDIKYDGPMVKNALAYLLMARFVQGFIFPLNSAGKIAAAGNIQFYEKTGMAFQDLLIDKLIEQIFEKRAIKSPKHLNEYLDRNWSSISDSFRMINRFIDPMPKPYGIKK